MSGGIPPPMTTLAPRRPQQEQKQPEAERPPDPNVMRAPVQTQYLPTPQQMSNDELELYTQRLAMRHKRLSTKWWGLRRKHSKKDCPYCGQITGGGFCKIHQRDYDEYITAKVIKMNRDWQQ